MSAVIIHWCVCVCVCIAYAAYEIWDSTTYLHTNLYGAISLLIKKTRILIEMWCVSCEARKKSLYIIDLKRLELSKFLSYKIRVSGVAFLLIAGKCHRGLGARLPFRLAVHSWWPPSAVPPAASSCCDNGTLLADCSEWQPINTGAWTSLATLLHRAFWG